MEELRLNLKRTKDIRNPHEYVRAMHGECKDWVFDEEAAPNFKGRWKQDVFKSDAPLDLEIGTGNGFFFAQRAKECPERSLLGIEVKYKPLIQAIRRARRNGSENMRLVRYDGRLIPHLFEKDEIDHVFIHHPDPWHKQRQHGRRMMNSDFLNLLFDHQKEDRILEFKTDSREYFLWAESEIKKTKYKIDKYTLDLHSSEWHQPEHITHFQKLFDEQQVPINYMTLIRS